MVDLNTHTPPIDTRESSGEIAYQPKVFTLSGRLGRLRYLAYGTGANLLLSFLLIAIMAFLAPDSGMVAPYGELTAPDTEMSAADGDMPSGEMPSPIAMAGSVIVYLAMLILLIIFGKRRLNDIDHSGWWVLLMIVPLVNLILGIYMVFARGTDGPNRFGPPPTSNPIGVVILGLALPVIMIVGIVAAIAIPAYMQYVQQAGM